MTTVIVAGSVLLFLAGITALISGLLVARPGGRLVMRILAETSPDSAQH
ncbi:hypothetical protein QFZ40_000325 [Arthrobacter pascens]|nr:hypothetical protein [Arthrobacter pascens]MDQ0632416.1 hypothetical protein [Arthrobacter pascens]